MEREGRKTKPFTSLKSCPSVFLGCGFVWLALMAIRVLENEWEIEGKGDEVCSLEFSPGQRALRCVHDYRRCKRVFS